MPERPWHLAVLIPARNEEALLRRCLESVKSACDVLPSGVTTDIIVVSDGSTDRTEAIALSLLRERGLATRRDLACVGAARAHAAELALSRFDGKLSRCWLANTDADCAVPRQWLLHQLSAAQRGVAAVAGIVDVDSFREHRPPVEALFRFTYRIHPDGTHPHVHGANLGVRADAYRAAGGWGLQSTAEDHDLWRRLRHTVSPCVSDAKLRVLTSGRRLGRAPFGFAAALAAHNETAQ